MFYISNCTQESNDYRDGSKDLLWWFLEMTKKEPNQSINFHIAE